MNFQKISVLTLEVALVFEILPFKVWSFVGFFYVNFSKYSEAKWFNFSITS